MHTSGSGCGSTRRARGSRSAGRSGGRASGAAAREAIERAAADFDALGSPGWAGQARAELARVGGRRPRAPGELTQTEQQVAALAADGRTNKEIAQALFVTVHTVEAHLSSTYAKLGVIAGAARDPPLRPDVRPIKIGVPRNFAEPGAAVRSLCVLPTGIAPERPRSAH